MGGLLKQKWSDCDDHDAGGTVGVGIDGDVAYLWNGQDSM